MDSARHARRIAAVALAATLLVASCSANEEGNDAPRVEASSANATVIAMPDEFTSVAAKCFGTDMIYAARNTNGRAIAVSPDHPWCVDGKLDRYEQDGQR